MIQFFASFLGILGGLLVAKKKVQGFHIWIIANLLWIFQMGISWGGMMFFVYLLLSIYSIREWKTSGLKEKQLRKEKKY